MFKVGEKVVYPHHGAGIIEHIEEKIILEEKRTYYIFKLSLGELKISVPVANSQDLGLRTVVSTTKARKVLKVISTKKSSLPEDWNERFRINNEKIGSGDIFSVAEVVRDLSSREGLSTREKRMFNKAKTILVSELMHSLNYSEQKINTKIEQLLN